MSETTWKLQELLECCPENYATEAEIYFRAVRGKIDRILYVIERLNEETFQVPTDSSDFKKKQLETTIYLETIAYNLHSLPDVLANIIFIFIINPLTFKHSRLAIKKDRDINIYVAKDKLNVIYKSGYTTSISQEKNLEKLIEKIDNLLNSKQYKYISALVNTIKHRNLIDTIYSLEIKSSKVLWMDKNTARQIESQKINNQWELIKFTKDGTDYESITIDKLINEDRKIIIELFYLAGQEINKYCQVTYPPSRPIT
ncbi:hypothetical protein [Laspinema olomoucense]|uniref:hypothetical protein n=1 Tax=Laspinema olomoucense TaxID=3231600 RepID=UPI0021BA9318|nr:hypothetical protein [Laspinema sp. D3d]MCT7971231.1 hypothetical protein [Laspinema sp. D3d]